MDKATAIRKLVEMVNAVADAVREAGPQGIPSGHLYAMMMPLGISLDNYNRLVEYAVGSGKITQDRSFVLRAC